MTINLTKWQRINLTNDNPNLNKIIVGLGWDQINKSNKQHSRSFFKKYQPHQRNQHFGMVNNSYVRLINDEIKKEMCRFNMTNNYSNMTATILGEIYRVDENNWAFAAIGQGATDSSISKIADRYR